MGVVRFSINNGFRSAKVLRSRFLFYSLPKLEFVVQSGQDGGVVFLWSSSPAFKVGCLTQRAADKWESARFSSLFLALSFSRLISRVSARPLVG